MQTTSRGNVNFGTGEKGVGANKNDATELQKRGAKMLIEGESVEALKAKGCLHYYTNEGIKEIPTGNVAALTAKKDK